MLAFLLVILAMASAAKAGCRDNWLEFKGYCYYHSANTMVHDDASAQCKHLNSRAFLASIHSLEENSFILEELSGVDSWIGLNDKAKEGYFEWEDGTNFDYQFWESGEPNNIFNEDCVMIHAEASGQWDDKDCGKKYKFICKAPADA